MNYKKQLSSNYIQSINFLIAFDHMKSSVSVGNVGQLAVDVLLSNAGPPVPQKIGRLFHPGIEAVVGADPCAANGDSSKLVTSCEGTKSMANLPKLLHLDFAVLFSVC